ncbi:MAG: polysaccharide deacetylase family protein [Sulfurovaceae bacterium]|nr:polysaccharide deacetylase family protein [Sulfurovaceae bacterium]
MTNIFITLDYELFFGSNSGTQERSIIYPTNRVLNILNKYNIKASFFIDSGYIIKLNEYRLKYPILENDYQRIISQIQKLSNNGHDIQLHIHPHWEDSYFDGTKWIIDTTRYRIQQFTNNKIDDIVYRYKKALTDIVKEDKVFTFRAGGWCIQPFDKINKSLKKHNIWLDSTIFNNGRNNSITHYFDFTNIPKKDIWKFEDNPLIEDKKGFFTEIPISSYKLSPLFFWKLAFAKKFGGNKHKAFGDGNPVGGLKLDKLRMLTQYTNSVVSIDGYKGTFLEEAYINFSKQKNLNNFVIIGHPKAMSEYSLKKLDEFIFKHKDKNFTTYQKEFKNEK